MTPNFTHKEMIGIKSIVDTVQSFKSQGQDSGEVKVYIGDNVDACITPRVIAYASAHGYRIRTDNFGQAFVWLQAL